ncbi:MAG: hypothetical protein WCK81_11865 [Betaproteobacteria bacterium]
MGPLDLINHLFNFVAPAVFVGVFMALVAPWVLRTGSGKSTFAVRVVVNSAAGVCAMTAGLWFFGNDGKMASYLALVLAAAASQFWLL